MVISPYYLPIILVLSLVLGVAFFWLGLYFVKRKEITKKSKIRKFFPKLSVIIPAYNEENNISTILKSIFKSIYPRNKLEIIVVDDGSTDNTAKIAKKFPVRLISYKQNKGKVHALNKGVSHAKGDIVITTDADAKIGPKTLALLTQHFKDSRVGAVSGIYKAFKKFSWKNPIGYLLEKFQTIEYFGFSLIRKQQEALNAVLVVPGSIAAYRKSVINEVNGFEDDTVIEDYDMTIKIHKAGYKVKCEKDALAWVVAPQTVKSLIRERTRWYRGGLQVIFRKHSDAFRTRLGAVTFIWILEAFGMILQFLILSLAAADVTYKFITYGLYELLLNLKLWLLSLLQLNLQIFDILLITSFILFTVGLINTTISMNLLRESKRKLLLYPMMMVYTTFLMFIFIKSFFQELLRKDMKWVKAEV